MRDATHLVLAQMSDTTHEVLVQMSDTIGWAMDYPPVSASAAVSVPLMHLGETLSYERGTPVHDDRALVQLSETTHEVLVQMSDTTGCASGHDDIYSSSMKITAHLDHTSHCKRASGTNWSNRWTYRFRLNRGASIWRV